MSNFQLAHNINRIWSKHSCKYSIAIFVHMAANIKMGMSAPSVKQRAHFDAYDTVSKLDKYRYSHKYN